MEEIAKAREIKKIIVHCSDSNWGDADHIDSWHKARGWKGIGYHYVILNGKRNAWSAYWEATDGMIELGRDPKEIGAHCEGENHDSLGICMVGLPDYFTGKQFATLRALVQAKCSLFGIDPSQVFCHNEFESAKKQGKTCPGFDHARLREILDGNTRGTDQGPPA